MLFAQAVVRILRCWLLGIVPRLSHLDTLDGSISSIRAVLRTPPKVAMTKCAGLICICAVWHGVYQIAMGKDNVKFYGLILTYVYSHVRPSTFFELLARSFGYFLKVPPRT